MYIELQVLFSHLFSEILNTLRDDIITGDHTDNSTRDATDHVTSSSPRQQYLSIRPIEVILVASIILTWLLAIMLFLRKWGTLRLSSAGEGAYRGSKKPKNLDSVKVVSAANNSVISFGHNKNLTRTMEARKQRLARMQTLPISPFASGQHVDDCCNPVNPPTAATAAQEPAATAGATPALESQDQNFKPEIFEHCELRELEDRRRPQHSVSGANIFCERAVTSEDAFGIEAMPLSEFCDEQTSERSAQWSGTSRHSTLQQTTASDVEVCFLDEDAESGNLSTSDMCTRV